MTDDRTLLEIATGVPARAGRKSALEIARAKLIPSEHVEQSWLIQRIEKHTAKYPELELLFAIPNGGHRDKAVAGKLKAEGVKRSIPDLMLPVARGLFHGLFIEMKKVGEYGTREQRVMASRLRQQGYAVFECQGMEEAYPVIMGYMALEPADSMRWPDSLDTLKRSRQVYTEMLAPRTVDGRQGTIDQGEGVAPPQETIGPTVAACEHGKALGTYCSRCGPQ